MPKLQIITSQINDGIMSNEKKYFKSLSSEERKKLYENTIERFLTKLKLNNNNSIQVKNSIKLLSSNNINVPLLTETDDNPVLIVSTKSEEKQTIAVTLLTLEKLNNNIIKDIIDKLMLKTDKAPFEMTYYIGPCPNKENYLFETMPKNLDNPLWKKVITKEKDGFHLDLRLFIFKELVNNIADPNYIYFDKRNTITDKNLFSKIANKDGKNLNVVVFTND